MVCNLRRVVNAIVDKLCFCVKQKTAYEMRISDWSSDVCSSDLALGCLQSGGPLPTDSRALRCRAISCAQAKTEPRRIGDDEDRGSRHRQRGNQRRDEA